MPDGATSIFQKTLGKLMLLRPRAIKTYILHLPLARKLLLLNMLGVASVLLITLLLFLLSYTYVADKRLRQDAEADSEILASSLAPMLAFQDQREAQEMVRYFVNYPDLQSLEVIDAQGRHFVSWRALELSIFKTQLEQEHRQPGWYERWKFASTTVDKVIILDDETLGLVRLEISYAGMHEDLLEFFILGVILTLMAMVVTPLVLSHLQARALASIFELSAVAENVAKNRDYSLRAQIRSRDEVSRLAFHFNQMLTRIEKWEMDIQAELEQRKESERQLDILANHDSLTKLPNRHYFHHRLEFHVEDSLLSGQMMALMFIDLDNFKYVNDHFGHETGDMVLIVVSKRLSSILRSSDSLCRLGGDEFAVILPNVGELEMAQNLAARLVASIREPIVIEGQHMPIGTSIGIACCPLHADDAKTLLHKADMAMYQAKKAGKNTFRLYQENQEESS
jgi:diguanylate cyclase (GGDEF)-like protein